MDAIEIYNLYPCVMTGRVYNHMQGKYKKLPFIPFSGDLADNCYYRETPTGFVLYKCNGYLQPVYIKYRNSHKYYRRSNIAYISTVCEWIEKNYYSKITNK